MIDFLLGLFEQGLKDAEKLVEDVDDARMAEQPAGIRNHPAWTLGHLVTAASFVTILQGEQPPALPESYQKLFPPGTQPTGNRADYPSKQELLAHLRAQHARAAEVTRARHATSFNQPSPENLRRLAPTVGAIVAYLLAAHEQNHVGQLIAWRRAAGYAKA
jgi:hypothetical protein